ncbi:MAG: hypothetical protein M3R06_04960, partial [Chloroflexota bacterium]|nr:hypothetical protein [Chloroflexota bacterium]
MSTAPLAVPRARVWSAVRWDRSHLRRLLLVAPLLLLLSTSAAAADRYRADRADRAAWYERANLALDAGRYPEAIEAFAAAGEYRDAAIRRSEAVAALAPYRTGYLDGLAALDAGRHDAAIAALFPVARDLPTYADAMVLLERARRGREADLRRVVDTATAAGDWLTAERAVALLAAEDPDDLAPRVQLAALQREHAPLAFARDGALFLLGPDGGDERLLTDAVPVSWPAWSPDKSRIAFVSLAVDSLSGNAKLYT